MTGIQVHPTGYGLAAARVLHGLVAAAKQRDPLRPVTVVAPTNSVGVAVRRMLASEALGPVTGRGRGVAGLSILTIYRLAELLGAPRLAADGRRPVSTPVVAAAVRGALAQDPGIFADVVDHPSTEASLVAAHRELSDCSEATLLTLSRAGRRAADVVAVHRAVRERLAADWYDEVDLMGAARAGVDAGTSVIDDVGEMVLHLPQVLSSAAADLVASLAGRTTVHVVAGFTGDEGADGDIRRTLRRLGASEVEVAPAPAIVVDRVVSVSDAEEEVRTATETVLDAMRTHGTPAERIAVVYPSPEPYAAIVTEHFGAAGLAWNGHADRATRQRVAARWLLDVLELHDLDWARSAVLNVLAGTRGGRSRQLEVRLHVAERVSRDAGVTSSIEGWLEQLTRYADACREQAVALRERPEDRDWLADRRDRDAADADALRRTVLDLAAEVDRSRQLTTWGQLDEWARGLVHDHLGDETARAGWPAEERVAADAVEAALDRIAALDGVEGHADLDRLRRTLELELDSGLGRTGAMGRGVLVGRPSDTLGVDLDLVVVLGLSEGVFPSRPREDSLLAEHERGQVPDELPPRHTRIHTQHRHLLAALASAGRRVLVHPRGDLRRSVERAPSRWLLDAVEATTGHRRLADQDLVTEVPSFADRVRRSSVPCDDQAFGLRDLAAHDPPDPAPDWLGPYAVGRRLLRDRASDRFTAFDGNLGDAAQLVGAPGVERPTSASALETWVRCPHGYLMQYVLRIDPVEDPEERLDMSPLEYGSLVHAVLEAWVQEQIDAGPPPPSMPWSPDARARLHELADKHAGAVQEAGLTGHPRLWEVKLAELHRLLDRFVDDDDRARADRGAVPAATEMAFGTGQPYPPVQVDLGDGRVVGVRGFVDRVDRTDDGGVVVIDYKTGGTSSYRDLSEDTPAADGSKLQLLVYGLAARQAYPDATSVRVEYQFVGPKETGKRIGYDVGRDAEQVLVDVVRLVVDHAGAGVFPQRPAEPEYHHFTPCLYCDPDELGTADRYRDWERLRQLPDLQAYVRQVEPDVLAVTEGSA